MEYQLLQIPAFWGEGNNPEYINALNDYLFITKQYQIPSSREFIGGMPVTLENDCFKQLLRVDVDNKFVYNMTLKVDGERYLMFLTTYGQLYFIDRRLNFYIFIKKDGTRLPKIDPEVLKPFLFDGELIQFKSNSYEFLLFDVLFYQGESFIEQNYHVRLDVISQGYSKVLYGFFQSVGLGISIKKWFPITDVMNGSIYSFIEHETNIGRREKLKADGLILQPFDTPYVVSGPWNKFNNVQFKWKPANEQTMDFKIKIESPNKWVLLTRSGYPFTMPVTGVPAVCKPTDANKRDFADGDVAEFLFNPKTELFKIIRARPNKDANSKDTVLSIFSFINNPFTLDQLAPVFESMLSGKNLKKVLLGLSRSKLILAALSFKGSFFTKHEVNNIKTFYEAYNQGKQELEIRLVKKGKKDSSVDKSIFNYLLESLNVNKIKTFTIDVSARGEDFASYRSSFNSFEDLTSGKSTLNETKSSIMRPYLSQENKVTNILFKLALSEETKTSRVTPLVSVIDGKRVHNLIRIKDRTSFDIGSWRIDLTAVKSGFSIDEANSKPEVYEIECEYIGTKVPFEQFLASFNQIYILILENSGYC